jgi:hypothetical protein
MKQTLILITAFSLLSCGSLKKDKQSIQTDTEMRLNASKMNFSSFKDSSFILKPFNPEKAIVIGKETIVNAIIENHYKSGVQIIKDTIVKHEKQVVEVEKMHKEKDNTKLFLGIAGIIALLLFVVILIVMWYFNV